MKTKKRLYWKISLAILSLLLAFTFTLLIPAPNANAEEVLKIGTMGTLSGSAAAWGLATKRGVEMAIDEVNARGGLKVAGKSYTLKQITYDDKYTGAGGTTAAQRLIFTDKVKFIMGPIGSGPTIAAGLIANREKVLILSNGFSPKILGPDKLYSFRVTITNSEYSPLCIKWLSEQLPEKKTFVTLNYDDELGQTLTPLLIGWYQDKGYKLLASELFERGTLDFIPILTRMLREKPDIIELANLAPADSGMLIKQARQLGFKGILVQLGGGANLPEVLNIAKEHAEDFVTYANFNQADPGVGVQKWIEAYKKKYPNERINDFCPIFYSGAKMLFDLIEQENSLDTDKIRIALENSDGYEGLLGPIKWTGKEKYGIRHQILLPFYINQIKNGKINLIGKVNP